MSEPITPPWLEGREQPTSEPPRGRWTPGMRSPNPSGRPKGIVDRRQRLQSAFAEDAVAIARIVITAALEGDMQACNIALARIAPTIKPQAERVQFSLSPDVPLAEQAGQVLSAVADGLVDPDTGKTLIACIHSVAGIRAVEDLESRLVMLEARQI